MNENLKKFMVTQLSVYRNQSDNDERVILFLKYLDAICKHSLKEQDFEDLRRRLEKIAECNYLDRNSLGQALGIEPFLRELYCLKTKDRSQVNFSTVLIAFDVFPRNWLTENGESWTFNTAHDFSHKNNYYKKIFQLYSEPYSFANVYCYRNLTAHNLKSLSLIEQAAIFSDILNVFVTSVWKMKGDVQGFIDSVNININDYFERLKTVYKKNKNYNKYIPPKGKVRMQYATATEKEEWDIFAFYEKCQQAKRLKLVGKAGMGKTTAIYEMINYDIEHYDKNHRVPVLLELIDVIETKQIEDYIADALNLSPHNVESLLENGKLSVYFDGLNEILLTDNSQKILLQKIMRFIEKYEKSFIVLSNRENNHIEVMNGEPVYYFLPLNDYQMDDFIDKNFPHTDVSFRADLKRHLDSYPEIRERARTPYMLKQLIDTTVATEGNLPKRGSDIIPCLLQAIINREVQEKKEKLANYAEDFLKQIAVDMPIEDGNGLSETKVRQVMASVIEKNVLPVMKEDVAKILTMLIELGILKNNKNRISFAYPDYKEYYFVKALDEDG